MTDPVLRTMSFGHDADGRKTATTNAALEVTSQQWSARGELTKLTNPSTNMVSRVYDAAGNQVTLTNRNGKKWQFQFDGANRLTNTMTPLNRQTTLAYDARGLLFTVREPSSQMATNLYDARGRLTNRLDQAGSIVLRYDAKSNRTNVVEAGKTNSWTFDAYDRPSTYTDADGNLIQYRYDLNGNVTNLIYPGNKTVTYFYDSLNRLTNVTDWANRQTTFTYDLASRLKSISRPNGTQRILNYDAAGQTTNIIEQTDSGSLVAFFKLNWNNAARAGWEFAAPLPHAYTPPTRTLTFDDDNRIATFNGSSVVYDLDGNMTSGPLTNNTFATHTYDSRNRLLNVGGLSYGYDAQGNRVTLTNGATVTKFVINPNAALSQVLMRVKSGVTNYYVYGLGLLYEADDSGNTKTYHYDCRGSTVALTDGGGIVTDRIEYSPYGLTTHRSGATDTPFLFNGRYGVQTDENGLLYMRARYYNGYLCRFLNADPAGFSGGLNFYAYADGNPVSYLDPFGLGAGEEGFFSWLGSQAAAGFKAGFGWGYDQVNNLGAALAGLGSDTIGAGLNMAGQAFGNPYLGQDFSGWAQDLYNSQNGFAKAGWYDASDPAVQLATLLTLFINPEGAAAKTAGLELDAATTWGRSETLADHFARHGADVGAKTADEYANMASRFLQESQAAKLPTKIDSQGVIRVFDPNTGTFGSFNPNGTTRTLFKPNSPTYFDRQPGILVP